MKLSHLWVSLLTAVALYNNPVQAQTPETVVLFTIAEFDSRGNEVPLAKTNLQLLDYLEKQLNIKFDLRRVPWKRAIENALNGEGMLMGMSMTKERKQKFVFSEPINGNSNWIVTRCDASFKYEKLDDLKSKTIGVVAGTSVDEEFDSLANILFQVEQDTGAGIARLKRLALKRVDALIWYGSVGNPKLVEDSINANYGINNDKQEKPFCVNPKPVSNVTTHFAMKIDPNKNQILQRISAALVKGRKDGSLPTLNIPN